MPIYPDKKGAAAVKLLAACFISIGLLSVFTVMVFVTSIPEPITVAVPALLWAIIVLLCAIYSDKKDGNP